MLDCQRNTAKNSQTFFSYTSLPLKPHMLMPELPVLNPSVFQSWWKVSCFLNHSAGDTLIAGVEMYPVC